MVGPRIAAVLLAPSATAAPEPGVDVETLSKNTVDGTDHLVTRITVAPVAAQVGTTTLAKSSATSKKER